MNTTASGIQTREQVGEDNENDDEDAESSFLAGHYYWIPAAGERFEISDSIHEFRVN